MSTAQVYWLTRLDGLHDFLNSLCIVSLIVGGVAICLTAFVGYLEDEEGPKAFAKSAVKWVSATVVVTGLLSCFVPTTKELVAIYGISYLTQNKDAREIPAEALKVLNQKLKEFQDDKKSE